MPLDIKHPVKPTEDDKIDDNDYMASHTITGKLPYSDVDIGDGIPQSDILGLGYQLIETKEISSQTSTTFSNLDGDEEEEYLVNFDLVFNNSSPDADIILKPNNIATNQYGVSKRIYNGGEDRKDSSNLPVLLGGFQSPIHAVGHSVFYAKSGQNRKIRSECSYDDLDSNYVLLCLSTGVWKNTSTNITSIVISSSASFTGTISLYKKIK